MRYNHRHGFLKKERVLQGQRPIGGLPRRFGSSRAYRHIEDAGVEGLPVRRDGGHPTPGPIHRVPALEGFKERGFDLRGVERPQVLLLPQPQGVTAIYRTFPGPSGRTA